MGGSNKYFRPKGKMLYWNYHPDRGCPEKFKLTRDQCQEVMNRGKTLVDDTDYEDYQKQEGIPDLPEMSEEEMNKEKENIRNEIEDLEMVEIVMPDGEKRY